MDCELHKSYVESHCTKKVVHKENACVDKSQQGVFMHKIHEINSFLVNIFYGLRWLNSILGSASHLLHGRCSKIVGRDV